MTLTTENLDEVRLLMEYRKAVRAGEPVEVRAVAENRRLQHVYVCSGEIVYRRNERHTYVMTGDLPA